MMRPGERSPSKSPPKGQCHLVKESSTHTVKDLLPQRGKMSVTPGETRRIREDRG